MNSTSRLVIRPFAASDQEPVAALLAGSPGEYTRYFHPFPFEASAIEALFVKAVRDQWFLLELIDNGAATPAGFYMLRGLDEGYANPMYGVFIAQTFSGRGLARLTLAHAEAQCRLNGWRRLLLKVDPKNTRAHALYQAAGFQFERADPNNEDQVFLSRELGT